MSNLYSSCSSAFLLLCDVASAAELTSGAPTLIFSDTLEVVGKEPSVNTRVVEFFRLYLDCSAFNSIKL